MKIIVTGASGFVGRNLVSELSDRGHDVIALTSNIREGIFSRNCCVRTVLCNMSEYHKLDIPAEMENADIFFHFAWDGTSGPKRADLELQMKNVLAVRDAIGLAHRCGCRRFVFAGSIMEYEASEYVGADFATPPPSFVYSCQKLAGDHIAKIETQRVGLEYIALIISNIFGPSEHSPRFLNTLVKKLENNETIALTQGLQQYDFIYMTDAIRAICLAGLQGRSNCSYYIGNSGQRTLREYVEAAKRCTGSHSVLDFGAVPYYGVASAYRQIDTQKLEKEFQFKPNVTFEEGIKKILLSKEKIS